MSTTACSLYSRFSIGRAMSSRAAKRDVIVISDDDSTSEPPAKKNVAKEAESVSFSSPGVAQIQQELLKSEQKFKHMFDMACEYKARVELLTKQLEEEREGRMRDRETIEPQQQPVIVKQEVPDEKPILNRNGVTSDVHTSGTEPNKILQPCDSNSPGSIPFDIASEFLRSRYVKCNLESLVKSCDVMHSEISNCDVCEKEIIGTAKKFHHFFSKDHADKMLARNVSQAAVYYWKEKLEQATTIVPTGDICNTTSILRSFDSTVPESISCWSIRIEFERNFNKCDIESLLALCANQFFACEDCGMNNLDANQAAAHFLTKEHTEKMSHRRVSLTAKWYWLEKFYQARSTVAIHNVCHPTNLFQLCRSDAPGTVSIYWARDLLYSLRNIVSTDYVNHKLFCELCKTSVHMHEVVGHLFGNGHTTEAKAVGSDRISLAAVRYWRELLQQKEDERRRREQQQQQQLQRRGNWRRRHHTSAGGDDMY